MQVGMSVPSIVDVPQVAAQVVGMRVKRYTNYMFRQQGICQVRLRGLNAKHFVLCRLSS